MSQTEIVVPGPFRNNIFVIIAMAVVSLALAVIIGMTSSGNIFVTLAVIFIFSTALIFTLFKFQNLIIMFVAFVIYTNTAVVLIKFHNVPAIIGYSLPLLLLFPFVWNIISSRQKIKVDFVFLLMLVYFAVMLLGSAFSRDINLAIPSVVNYFAEGLGLYFLLINTIRTPRLLNSVVWTLLVGGALLGGLSLFQQITGTFDNNYGGFALARGQGFVTDENLQGEIVQPRVSGSIGEKNRYAQIMLMLVPIGLFQAWGERSRGLRLLAYIFTGLIFIGGSLAFSRGAQVGLLLLIAMMTFMRYIKVRELLIIMLGVALLVLAFPQNWVRFSSLGAIFAAEEEGGLRSADGAIQGRATEMLAAMLVFIDHPIIGVGPGMFGYEMAEYSKIIGLRHITTTREAHSLYPGVAAETGALGFITLMSIFIYVLYRLAKSRRYWLERGDTKLANLCTGFFLAIISYMTTGIFLHFAYIRYFWLMIALAAIASGFRETDFAKNENAFGENTR